MPARSCSPSRARTAASRTVVLPAPLGPTRMFRPGPELDGQATARAQVAEGQSPETAPRPAYFCCESSGATTTGAATPATATMSPRAELCVPCASRLCPFTVTWPDSDEVLGVASGGRRDRPA